MDTEKKTDILLNVNDLKTHFPVKKGLMRRTVGYVKAVNGISLQVESGRSFGLVGESGCGKTTAARTIAGLIAATAGSVEFDGIDVLNADKKQLSRIRRDLSIIFQDPYGSLNPRMTVGNIVAEPMKVQGKMKPCQMNNKVADLLIKVGLSPEYINRYPHEFSGGQRQRIGIARSLALEPKLVICDEPVSALDVSIQSQILNLLKDLQDEFGLTYLFIAHDLAVVEFFCDIIAVMYMGRIVEQASSKQLYHNPIHPYTKVLISAIPKVDPSRRGKKRARGGEVPSVMNQPSGCAFHPRCPIADADCRQDTPELIDVAEGHKVACWKYMEKFRPER